MPKRSTPTQFTVAKPFSMGGSSQTVGSTISAHNARVGLGAKLAVFVSRGFLVPNVPLYPLTARRAVGQKEYPDYYLNPKELLSL